MSRRARFLFACITALVLAPVRGASAQVPFPGQDLAEDPQDCELIRNQWVYIRVLSDGTSNSYVSGPMEVRCAGGIRIQADSAVIFEASGYTQLFDNVMFEDQEKRLNADRANYFDRAKRLVATGNGRIIDKVRNSVITGDTVIYIRANQFQAEDILNVHGGSPHAILFPPERAAGTAAGDEVADPELAEGPVPDSVEAGEGPASDSVGVAEGQVPDSVQAGEAPADAVVDATGRRPRVAEPAAADSAEATGADPDGQLAEASPQTPPPPAARSERPYEVDATRFSIAGDRFFRAMGDVVIRRDSLEAVGDSLEFDQRIGDVMLLGNAGIEEDAYELTGTALSLGEGDAQATEVRAIGEALLVSEQVDVSAHEIRIYLADGTLQRMVAVKEPPDTSATDPGDAPPARTAGTEDAEEEAPPSSRPRAIAEDFVLEGDSLEVVAPNEVLEQVVAVGSARGESLSRDSLNTEDTPEVARRDWMEGRTIVAYFTPVSAAGAPVLDSAAAAPGLDSATATLALDSAAATLALDSAAATLALDSAAAAPALDSAVSVLAQDSAVAPPPADSAAAVAALLSAAAGQVADSASAPGGPGGQYTVDRIVAQGSARSLYRMTPSDTTGAPTPGRLALHYVTGTEITIRMKNGEITSMEVSGQTRGYHLEPLAAPLLPDSLPPDSAVADTVALPVPRADTATSGATPSDTAASGASAAGFFTAGATASDASGTVDQGGSEPPRPRRDDEPGAASARGPAWARDQETP
jgi:lipopolysaccharide export system protein LptA